MIRRPPRSTRKESSAASDVYKRQVQFAGLNRGITNVSVSDIELVVFSSEADASLQLALAAGGHTEDVVALCAFDDGLGVREHNHYLVALRTSHVQEVRVGTLHQTLELVLSGFFDRIGVE
eukprot:TRINITY_DN3066_c0_g1_i7.p1 TRINITY_DN3066_c0_g1~~TRINITY_DN3066_c0_g1_i7.p1  ORF type:complete len:129 (+),score=23.61 TRINITY_DN3066_c0_g1_i7:25-387(+)